MRLFFPTAALIIAFAICSFGQTKTPTVDENSIKADLAQVQCNNKVRLDSVRALFLEKGAKPENISEQGTKKVTNLVIEKKGKTPEIIVIGAHYDKVADGCGAIDNWTGIVVLANIYEAFVNIDTEKTLLFVAFGREEEGLIGSRAMASAIPKESRTQYCSMVNLDSFGLHYPQVLTNTSNSKMTSFTQDLARELKMPFAQASLAGNADADSSSFLDVRIPAITFHGLTNRWADILHTSSDKLEKIKVPLVLAAYQFAAIYLDRIERKSCAVFR